MKHIEGSRLYKADDGKFIVRLSDEKIMGDGIDLGENDSIENYQEVEYTEESRKEFFESIGMCDPKKRMAERNKRTMDLNLGNRPGSNVSEQNPPEAVAESVSSAAPTKTEKKSATRRKTSKRRVAKTAKQEISK